MPPLAIGPLTLSCDRLAALFRQMTTQGSIAASISRAVAERHCAPAATGHRSRPLGPHSPQRLTQPCGSGADAALDVDELLLDAHRRLAGAAGADLELAVGAGDPCRSA